MASARLTSCASYIRLLLETTKEQALALLSTATTRQIEAIGEIAFNLITLSLPANVKRLVTRSKDLLQKLAKKKISFRSKIRLLKKNCSKFMSLLQKIKTSLLNLL